MKPEIKMDEYFPFAVLTFGDSIMLKNQDEVDALIDALMEFDGFEEEWRKGKDRMLYLNGSTTAYHCPDCNSNVFKQVSEDKEKHRATYCCNGCGSRWRAESED
jgi:hypothetical protein